jgi:hypothetical protein
MPTGLKEGDKMSFHPSYLSAVERTAASVNWLKMLTEFVPSAMRRIGQKNAFSLLINAFVEFIPVFSPADFIMARLEFSADQYINRITAGEVPIPIVIFEDARQYEKFLAKLGRAVVPECISVRIPFGALLSRMGLLDVPDDLRALTVLFCYEEPAQLQEERGPSEPKYIAEKMRAIDPLSIYRGSEPDGPVLSEMIAIIGEAAVNDYLDKNRVDTHKNFWTGRLDRTSGFSHGFINTFRLQPASLEQRRIEYAAEEMVKVIQDLTGRNKNSDLVRLMMNCVSFSDLHRELQKRHPEYYAPAAV